MADGGLEDRWQEDTPPLCQKDRRQQGISSAGRLTRPASRSQIGREDSRTRMAAGKIPDRRRKYIGDDSRSTMISRKYIAQTILRRESGRQ